MFRNLQIYLAKRFYCKQVEKLNQVNDFWKDIKHSSKISKEPYKIKFKSETTSGIKIDLETIHLLERLSLVDLEHKDALKTIQDSIQFADLITYVNTDAIDPLYTVLEQEELYLREDNITDGNIKNDILNNAKVTEEDYFIAPPGNIPIEQENKELST
ncbi:glutamyl-tRNA(Gln) amidotransferase subunit C, mitochondrial [Condylostylus longicornis]|uniref:glutamyl-tRNA(Gln) amidotransferase subunit C, mitochondrial n=1 Tax=Condylostylus longicornis TaxID=2530218 RepID=UPI00244DD002|nr:glutamyl-tRNA(Gln) amidotransferase subunit C, mitochondrial [Condylostylus longicornis]